jgi:hypothetical protein
MASCARRSLDHFSRAFPDSAFRDQDATRMCKRRHASSLWRVAAPLDRMKKARR